MADKIRKFYNLVYSSSSTSENETKKRKSDAKQNTRNLKSFTKPDSLDEYSGPSEPETSTQRTINLASTSELDANSRCECGFCDECVKYEKGVTIEDINSLYPYDKIRSPPDSSPDYTPFVDRCFATCNFKVTTPPFGLRADTYFKENGLKAWKSCYYMPDKQVYVLFIFGQPGQPGYWKVINNTKKLHMFLYLRKAGYDILNDFWIFFNDHFGVREPYDNTFLNYTHLPDNKFLPYSVAYKLSEKLKPSRGVEGYPVLFPSRDFGPTNNFRSLECVKTVDVMTAVEDFKWVWTYHEIRSTRKIDALVANFKAMKFRCIEKVVFIYEEITSTEQLMKIIKPDQQEGKIYDYFWFNDKYGCSSYFSIFLNEVAPEDTNYAVFPVPSYLDTDLMNFGFLYGYRYVNYRPLEALTIVKQMTDSKEMKKNTFPYAMYLSNMNPQYRQPTFARFTYPIRNLSLEIEDNAIYRRTYRSPVSNKGLCLVLSKNNHQLSLQAKLQFIHWNYINNVEEITTPCSEYFYPSIYVADGTKDKKLTDFFFFYDEEKNAKVQAAWKRGKGPFLGTVMYSPTFYENDLRAMKPIACGKNKFNPDVYDLRKAVAAGDSNCFALMKHSLQIEAWVNSMQVPPPDILSFVKFAGSDLLYPSKRWSNLVIEALHLHLIHFICSYSTDKLNFNPSDINSFVEGTTVYGKDNKKSRSIPYVASNTHGQPSSSISFHALGKGVKNSGGRISLADSNPLDLKEFQSQI